MNLPLYSFKYEKYDALRCHLQAIIISCLQQIVLDEYGTFSIYSFFLCILLFFLKWCHM